MIKIKRGVAFGIAGLVAVGSLCLMGTASAYSIGGSTTRISNAVNLPQLPAGTFNLNWTNFFNALPIQSFITSLESNGNTAVNNSIKTVTPTLNAHANQVGQTVLQQIDNWTSTNLGFRFSALFAALLGIISWVLGLAQTIVNWLLGLVH